MTKLYGHAIEAEPLRWKGPFLSRDAAINDAHRTYPKTSGFYVVEGAPIVIGDYVPDCNVLTDVLIEELWLCAFQRIGDRADGFPELPDVPAEHREELHRAVKSWVLRRLSNGWAPTKLPDYIRPLVQLFAVK